MVAPIPRSKPRFVRRVIFYVFFCFRVFSFSGARCAEPRLARRGKARRGAMVAPRSKPRFVRRVKFFSCSGARCAKPRPAGQGQSRSPGRDGCGWIKTPVRSAGEFFFRCRRGVMRRGENLGSPGAGSRRKSLAPFREEGDISVPQ